MTPGPAGRRNRPARISRRIEKKSDRGLQKSASTSVAPSTDRGEREDFAAAGGESRGVSGEPPRPLRDDAARVGGLRIAHGSGQAADPDAAGGEENRQLQVFHERLAAREPALQKGARKHHSRSPKRDSPPAPLAEPVGDLLGNDLGVRREPGDDRRGSARGRRTPEARPLPPPRRIAPRRRSSRTEGNRRRTRRRVPSPRPPLRRARAEGPPACPARRARRRAQRPLPRRRPRLRACDRCSGRR